jgi:hypothetical protein
MDRAGRVRVIEKGVLRDEPGAELRGMALAAMLLD